MDKTGPGCFLESPSKALHSSRYESCEGLNTLSGSQAGSGSGSSYNKYNSLDRRRLSKLSKLSGGAGQSKDQASSGGFMRLSAYVPNSEPKLRPYRLGKEPERRHSSYYPTSSLARTPSSGADFAKLRSSKMSGEATSQSSHSSHKNKLSGTMPSNAESHKNSEYLNPINILGIPSTGITSTGITSTGITSTGITSTGITSTSRRQTGMSPVGPAVSRSSSSNAGRLGLGGPLDQDRGNFRILKNSFSTASRCGMGSLLNLNKIPHKSSLQRSNSARECGGEYLQQGDLRIQGDYQTPSPADSAVHDLGNDSREERERERGEGRQQDLPLALPQPPHAPDTQRKTLKKEKPGKKDAVMKVKSFYEAQLKNFQQNAAKMEESLVNQIYQIKKERDRIELDVENLTSQTGRQRQENGELRREIAFLREQNDFKETDELQADGRDDSEVIIGDLKLQLDRNKTELEQTKEELLSLTARKLEMEQELTRLKSALEEKQEEDLDLDGELRSGLVEEYKQTIIERDQTIESLRSQMKARQEDLADLQDSHLALRSSYKTETDNWLSEKEKVIKYQKQLQLNYVSMYNKNKQLEAEVEQLKSSLQKATAPKAASTSPMSVAKTKYLSKFSSKFSDL